MANPHKGETSVTIDGQNYTLSFSVNSICEIEEVLDRTWVDIAFEMQSWLPKFKGGKPVAESKEKTEERTRKFKTSLIRALFWGALRDHHSDLTLKDAGILMGKMKDTDGGAFGAIVAVINQSNPPADEGGGDAESPPKQAVAA